MCSKQKSRFSYLFLQLNLDQLPNNYLLQIALDESVVKYIFNRYRFVMEKLTLLMKEIKLNDADSKMLSLSGTYTGSKAVEVFSLFGKNNKTYPMSYQ